METADIQAETLQNWIREGWKFRIKNVKGKTYITRYKGRMERSLGAYSEELWRRIEELKASSRPSETLPANILEEIESLKREVQDLSRRLEAVSVLVPETVHGKKLWIFTKVGTFTKQIGALKNRVEEMEDLLLNLSTKSIILESDVKELKTIPTENLYRQFKCDKCGSQHLVAVKIKCTKCGAESWWGYRP